MSDETQYLTVAQAAARLQTSDEMVRRMLRDGRLRGKRLGGKRAGWRLAASEIDRLLEPDPQPRPGPRPSRERRAALATNARDLAERARARGDERGAAIFERMAAEAAEAQA
jgi:excisionase family DNA binding protein